MTDQMVLKTQQWLNRTYRSKAGFGSVIEDGYTGWGTVNALIRGLCARWAPPADLRRSCRDSRAPTQRGDVAP